MIRTSALPAGIAKPARPAGSGAPLAALCLLGACAIGAAHAQSDPSTAASTADNRALSAEINRLRQELSLEVERGRQLGDQVKRLEQASQENTGERERLAAELAETRTRLEATSRELNTLQAEQRRAAERLALAEGTLADARQQVDSLSAERDQLQQQLRVDQQSLETGQRELAAANGRLERLERDLAMTREALGKTTGERDELSGRLSQAQAEIDRGMKALGKMGGERDQLTQRLKRSEVTIGSLEQRALATDNELSATRAEVSRLTGELRQLERRNTDLQADVALLKGELQASRDEGAALRGDMATLKAGLPPELGGSASLQQLKSGAASLAEQMRTMHRTMRRQPQNTALQSEFDATARQLRERQLLIAGETGAVGLYRLRPEDTLATVAARFLGDGNLWGRIYQANAHIIEDPDRLIAGLTLVLP
jgi:chromosome segregation ATPase